jgi:hypothetical protein
MTSHPFIAGMIITCPSLTCGYALYEVTRWALTEDLLDANQNFMKPLHATIRPRSVWSSLRCGFCGTSLYDYKKKAIHTFQLGWW